MYISRGVYFLRGWKEEKQLRIRRSWVITWGGAKIFLLLYVYNNFPLLWLLLMMGGAQHTKFLAVSHNSPLPTTPSSPQLNSMNFHVSKSLSLHSVRTYITFLGFCVDLLFAALPTISYRQAKKKENPHSQGLVVKGTNGTGMDGQETFLK